MHFISQSGQHDCAYTCLSIMLSHFHKDKNYLFLKHEDRPYTYDELIKEGRQYGLVLQGVKILDEYELMEAKTFPFITTIIDKEKKSKHAVIILKANKKYVTFFDPSLGKRRLDIENFTAKWTKKALIVKEVNKTPCPITPPDFVAKKDKITLPIWQLLSGISLFLGGYFLNKDSFVFLPMLFAALFIIFELLFRDNLIRACKRMDVNIKSYQLNVNPEDYYTLYKDIEEYRVGALTGSSNIIYVFLLELMFTFILVLNSPLNLIYIFLAVLLALCEHYLIHPYFKKKEIEVMEFEEKVKEAGNDYNFDFYSTEAREKAYKIAQQKMAINYVSIAMLLLSIILVMAISHITDITYIVFYLCASYFLKSEFYKIFAYADTQKDTNCRKLRIINRLK